MGAQQWAEGAERRKAWAGVEEEERKGSCKGQGRLGRWVVLYVNWVERLWKEG